MSKDTIIQITWKTNSTPPELQPILKTLGEEYPISEGSGNGIAVRFESGNEPGVCTVTRKGQEATVRYQSPAMAIRAVGALMAGLVEDGRETEERSPFTFFGIMLDCSRNAVMLVEHFKKWLRRLSLLGYNMAMLYTEDTYKLPGENFFGYLRGAYTADELKEIDNYASQLGIEMIPCIQTLGHLEQILKWHAYKEIKDTQSVMLVDEKKTYALIDKMLTHWVNVYRSRRIHVGMDETHDLGRGKYMDQFGYKRGFDIFNQHLAKVVKLCEKHGLKPMIWSDMYFRMGSKTGDYYDENCAIPQDVIDKIPQEVELVYWDYYHKDKAFYLDWIKRHRAFGSEPIMGSGVWTWGLFWYNRQLTEPNAGACIEACREAGIKEIFFTMWGDDGAYGDFDSAFAGLAFTAEKAFAGNIQPDALNARFRAVCGTDYITNCLATDLNSIMRPSQVLWDDPLLGIYLQNVKAIKDDALTEAEQQYLSLASKLDSTTMDNKAGDLNHAHLLTLALAAKTGLAHRVIEAYAKRDLQALSKSREEIPRVTEALQKLLASFRSMWLAHNKPFGLEVIQIRFGGLLARYEELDKRLDEYLEGTIKSIPELDENLPHAPQGGSTGTYRNLATASSIL